MGGKSLGYGLVGVGVLLALVALLADVLGLGNDDGFGSQQGVLLAIGIVVAAAGGYLTFRPSASQGPASE